MKRSITVVALLAAAVCAHAAEDGKSEKTATAPQRVTIPKDAVKEANGSYSYTDAQGKKWTYRESPFGVIKTSVPEPAADTPAKPKPPAVAIKVIDKGDTVQFERSTPFGPNRWEKKKSDLTEEERKMVDAQDQSKTESHTETQTQTDKPEAK